MSQDVLWLQYIAPSGESITMDVEGSYFLTEVDGLSQDDSRPVATQAPGQVGVTVTDIEFHARIVTAIVEVLGTSWEDYFDRRKELTRVLARRPAETGERVPLGLLRAHVIGGTTYEIAALPRREPRIGINQFDHRGFADLEFFCPDSDWLAPGDQNLELAAGASGFTFPLEFPFESLSGTTQADIENEGDVRAPVRIRVFGELTTPRIINVTTGKQIEVAGHIADGEFLEIRTGFGDKAVELVQSDGTRVNKMSDLNLDASDFWHLAVGHNTVRLEADSNVSGTAWVTWRNRFAGI